MFRREKRQPDGLHACGTTGEKEKSLSVLFKGPGSQNQSKKKIKKNKKWYLMKIRNIAFNAISSPSQPGRVP